MRIHFIFEPDSAENFLELGLLAEKYGFEAVWTANHLSARDPFMAFSVQGGDTQDQNLLQFFLNVVEFGMKVQQAVEAHNITSYQMQSSFGAHKAEPGRMAVTDQVPESVRDELTRMGYSVETVDRTYSPITAIYFDNKNGTMWGGASDYGEDYGVAW